VGEDRREAGADRRRLTVPQAAEALGVTVDAVRGRIRRGKLEAEHEAGAVYVWIDAPASPESDSRGPSSTSRGPSADQSGRIEDLREQVAYLRDQLEQSNERDRENRRIIAALTSRIPAIEAPEARESPETTAGEPERAEPRPGTSETQDGAERPWWRRWFGG
jgi:hypothetical protein